MVWRGIEFHGSLPVIARQTIHHQHGLPGFDICIRFFFYLTMRLYLKLNPSKSSEVPVSVGFDLDMGLVSTVSG